MKRMKNISLLLAVMLCVCLFTACSANETEESTETEIVVEDETENTGYTEEESADEDVSIEETGFTEKIGLVSSVSEESITLTLYENDAEESDFAAMDVSTLTSTGNWETIILSDEVTYWYIENGVETSASFEELTVDSMIAVITDEYEIQKIIILEKGENEAISENNVIFAMVESIEDDYFTLNIYSTGETETDSQDIDYASVEWDNYTNTYETLEYVCEDDVTVQIAEDGVLIDSDTASIAEGDMIVIHQDDLGSEVIVVYQNIE